jgi:fructokinase
MMNQDQTYFDVLSFGEALVDFLPSKIGVKLREVDEYTRNLGGAPANLAYSVARLGGRCALVGRLGDDEFGHYLSRKLQKSGVDVSGITHTKEAKTGIVFVEIDASGERSFTFYRHPSADMTIRAENIDLDVVRRSNIVHSGTNLMVSAGSAQANLLVLEEARSAGRLVSLDANIRMHQWPSAARALETITGMFKLVDLLKVNEEEMTFLFGDTPPQTVFNDILRPRGVQALLLTLGGGGATVLTPTLSVDVPAPTVDVLDTTGAGDAFLAGLLRGLSIQLRPCGDSAGAWDEGLKRMDTRAWQRTLTLANHIGALACTSFGATTAIPDQAEISWSSFGLG